MAVVLLPLEKKSISITRLKRKLSGVVLYVVLYLKRKVSRLRDWNISQPLPPIEIIRAWKEKYLDYEIETWYESNRVQRILWSWKEKYLDYEIETMNSRTHAACLSGLKRKVSRLRDWNFLEFGVSTAFPYLKRKVSRLRDWNLNFFYHYFKHRGLKRKVSRLRDWNHNLVVDEK